jgi:hypothetical protein
MKKLSLFLLLVFSVCANATFQQTDTLNYENISYSIGELPLDSYLRDEKIDLTSYNKGVCSANWRGYIGNWAIIENKLYLTSMLDGQCNNHTAISLTNFFHPTSNGQFANWYTGQLSLYTLNKRYHTETPLKVLQVKNGIIVN